MNSESWGRLFSREELQAMYDRAQAQQFAERQRKLAEMQANYQPAATERSGIPEKKPFVYQARTPEQWDARASQQPAHRPRWERIHGHWCLTQQGRDDLTKKVKTLLELAVEYRDETDMEELAASADMSVSWVRKHLRKAGIRLPLRRQRQS